MSEEMKIGMLHTRLLEIASEMPEKIAVIHGKERVSYGKISSGVSRLASYLSTAGVKVGDRVGVLSENSPEYVIAFYGIQKAGCVSVDINPQYSSHEIRKISRNCMPSVLIVDVKFLPLVTEMLHESPHLKTLVIIDKHKKDISEDLGTSNFPSHVQPVSWEGVVSGASRAVALPETSEKDIAAIIYTSGTTGEPKGVMLSHENLFSNADSIIRYLALTRDDRVMVVLPFCYSYGKSLLTSHMMVGGTVILANSFMYPNVILDKMVREEATGFAGVPSTFALLLNRSNIRNFNFPRLRYVTQAGGPMPPKHAKEISGILSHTKIYIMYGQTEATARLTYLDPDDLLRKTGSIGKPIPGVTIELIKENGQPAGKNEEGEIVAAGKNIMVGYWNNLEETRKVMRDGKLFTGDIATMDDEGYIYIVGRRSDMIKSGAHRISPKEIEEVILEMREVHEVSVVGTQDDILGEAIRAVVVLKDDICIEGKAVQSHCRKKLASFKVPKEVFFVKGLPKTNSGKVKRHLLRDEGGILNCGMPASA